MAERIQNLGGTPVDDEGIIGSVQGFIGQFMIPDTTKEMVESALKGESRYGVQLSEEIVKGDLDVESRRLIESILDEDRGHVRTLQRLVH